MRRSQTLERGGVCDAFRTNYAQSPHKTQVHCAYRQLPLRTCAHALEHSSVGTACSHAATRARSTQARARERCAALGQACMATHSCARTQQSDIRTRSTPCNALRARNRHRSAPSPLSPPSQHAHCSPEMRAIWWPVGEQVEESDPNRAWARDADEDHADEREHRERFASWRSTRGLDDVLRTRGKPRDENAARRLERRSWGSSSRRGRARVRAGVE